MLDARAAENAPIRVAQVGAGKFGTMFLSQARLMRGVQAAGPVDLDPGRAGSRLADAGWEAERYGAASLD